MNAKNKEFIQAGVILHAILHTFRTMTILILISQLMSNMSHYLLLKEK